MIIAFTKDWDDVPTCTTHILREMAKEQPVLWVNSIGTRRPRVGAGGDWRRIARRLRQFLKGAEWKEHRLWVLSPLLIPGARSVMARAINRVLFKWQLGQSAWRMAHGVGAQRTEHMAAEAGKGEENPQTCRAVASARRGMDADGRRWEKDGATLPQPAGHFSGARCHAPCAMHSEYWCFVPNAVDLLPPDGTVVYYCVDDWSQFHNLDGAWLAEKEQQLLARADFVFAASKVLVDKLGRMAHGAGGMEGSGSRVQGPERDAGLREPGPCSGSPSRPPCPLRPPAAIRYSPHGVQYGMFRAALEPGDIPPDMAGLARPRVGFYGNLHPWVDLALVARLAAARPGWSFVLVGTVYADLSPVVGLRNVVCLGRREHVDLPAYCRAFDAAMIPYDMKQSRMQSVNPVKTLELLAAGVPVVASDIPELRGFSPDVAVCRDDGEWLAALDRAVRRTDRLAISDRVARMGWPDRVRELRRIVDAAA